MQGEGAEWQSFKQPGADVHPLKQARTQMTTICTSLCEARPYTLPRLVPSRTLAAAWIYRGEREGSPHLSDSPQPSQLLQGGASHKPTAEACPAGGVRPWPRPLASAGPPDRRTGHRPTSSPPHRCTTFPPQPVAGAGLFQAAQVWWPQRRCSSPDFFGPDSPRDVAEQLPSAARSLRPLCTDPAPPCRLRRAPRSAARGCCLGLGLLGADPETRA